MLQGNCEKCGARWLGWALRFSYNQSCPRCGGALYVYMDGRFVSKGNSLLTGEKFSLNAEADSKDSHKTTENN
jgi:hypothetical protein